MCVVHFMCSGTRPALLQQTRLALLQRTRPIYAMMLYMLHCAGVPSLSAGDFGKINARLVNINGRGCSKSGGFQPASLSITSFNTINSNEKYLFVCVYCLLDSTLLLYLCLQESS